MHLWPVERQKIRFHQYLGEGFKDQRSIKIVQAILERQYVSPMQREEDRFRAAFVVFVVSNLLCPSAKYDYASVDYWNAIQDPDDLSSYDWCGFVFTRLLEGVTKLKQDIANNIKFPNIAGCSVLRLVCVFVIEGKFHYNVCSHCLSRYCVHFRSCI